MPDFDRYLRQLNLKDFSIEKQKILEDSKVFIGGVGGLGGVTAQYLTCAGIKKFNLCHFGRLELSDLNRQILMNEDEVGSLRVEIAKKSLKRINKNLEIKTFYERINDENIIEMLDGCNLAISARPNFYERLSIAKGCLKMNIPMIDGAMCDMYGHVFIMVAGETACYGCLFNHIPNNWEELGFPVLGAFSGLIGTIVAIEAIKVLTDWHSPFKGYLITIDGVTWEINKIFIKRNKNCKFCGD